MTHVLEPCPFCGMCPEEFDRLEAQLNESLSEQGYIPYVVEAELSMVCCPNCGATLIVGAGVGSAVEIWNMRPDAQKGGSEDGSV